MSGTLFVVATPIGNLGDISSRAAETLRNADIIAAEDTRTSGVLLDRLGIGRQKLRAYHKFNEETGSDGLVAELVSGKDVALITDAGTPCVSDPGSILVRKAVSAGICATAVPGASAVAAAISVSGFNAVAFAFYGFLPRKDRETSEVLRRINSEYARVAVFYESPKRIEASLELICRELPGAEICLCNDLTKKFERIYRGSAGDVLSEVRANPDSGKGEYAIVINLGPDKPGGETDGGGVSPEAGILELVLNGASVREASDRLIALGKYSKNDIKRAAIRVKERFELD
ncbi:MAG: 16S rRNA (cytidine(1402)-2'-O)-methyltransferase [Eubacteriales bacterium]